MPGDVIQIHRVLMNLCGNAAHALRDSGGAIDVSPDRVFVDDELALQDLGERMLRSMGYRVAASQAAVKPWRCFSSSPTNSMCCSPTSQCRA